LYGGTLYNPIDYDQYGNVIQARPGYDSPNVWTGLTYDGLPDNNDPYFGNAVLGSPSGWIVDGAPSSTKWNWNGEMDFGWLCGQWQSERDPFSQQPCLACLFALSAPITVSAPEPTAFTLLVTALLGFIGFRLVRRRNRAA
jgi:hypothetical protein